MINYSLSRLRGGGSLKTGNKEERRDRQRKIEEKRLLSERTKRIFEKLVSGKKQLGRANLHKRFSDKLFDGEFDPGSGRTLAACLTHASRAELEEAAEMQREPT